MVSLAVTSALTGRLGLLGSSFRGLLTPMLGVTALSTGVTGSMRQMALSAGNTANLMTRLGATMGELGQPLAQVQDAFSDWFAGLGDGEQRLLSLGGVIASGIGIAGLVAGLRRAGRAFFGVSAAAAVTSRSVNLANTALRQTPTSLPPAFNPNLREVTTGRPSVGNPSLLRGGRFSFLRGLSGTAARSGLLRGSTRAVPAAGVGLDALSELNTQTGFGPDFLGGPDTGASGSFLRGLGRSAGPQAPIAVGLELALGVLTHAIEENTRATATNSESNFTNNFGQGTPSPADTRR